MSRQELYDEIKKTSKDAYILSEMKRLGFWDDTQPKISEELIERKVALQKEMSQLSMKIKDPKTALKEIHKRRMKEALLRREETKAKREAREQKAKEARKQRKENALGFIGHSFIADLSREDESDAQKLEGHGLFLIKDAKDLAQKMGIALTSLRYLAYTQKLAPKTDYVRFKITKKTGGFREISAPKPQLKRLQYWILDNILNKVSVSEQTHGFVSKKSILTNATPHLGRAVVINCDLQNFFPTVNYARVKGLFQSMGYSSEVAALLALLTTEAEQKEVILDGEKLFLYTGARYLPQGSPASPMITNLICRKLDRRMDGVSQKLGFTYTRYADDMTFSAESYTAINKMLYWVKKITQEEGFTLHPEKTRIMKKGARQEVTGIVVNEKPSISRKELKKFRALLYQIEQEGIEGKSWQGKRDNLIASIYGYACFIKMVDPLKGAQYLAQVKEIMKKYPLETQGISSESFRIKSARGEEPLRTKLQETDESYDAPPLEEKKPSLMQSILKLFRK